MRGSRRRALVRNVENVAYARSGLNELWVLRILLDLVAQRMNSLPYEVSLSLVLRPAGLSQEVVWHQDGPALAAKSDSKWYSMGVNCTSWPPTSTRCSVRSTRRSPAWKVEMLLPRVESSRRLQAARTLATSSLGEGDLPRVVPSRGIRGERNEGCDHADGQEDTRG